MAVCDDCLTDARIGRWTCLFNTRAIREKLRTANERLRNGTGLLLVAELVGVLDSDGSESRECQKQ